MRSRWSTTEEPPPGLRYVPDFVGDGEESALLAAIETLPFHAVVMRGQTARRTVVHFGWDYGYDAWTLTPAAALPAFLRPLRERAAALAGLAADSLEQVLVARYPPGAAIGWHRDAPFFGPTVVGISLGGEAAMRFRRAMERGGVVFRFPLAPRSAYVLGGAARATWQHALAPTKTLRYSVTFRTVREGARREAQANP